MGLGLLRGPMRLKAVLNPSEERALAANRIAEWNFCAKRKVIWRFL